MHEKQFAFIPWWIIHILRRNNLKNEDLLSFEKIRKVFSTEDLTSLVALSYMTKYFVNKGNEYDTTHWCDRWVTKTTDARTQALINDIANLAGQPSVQDDILTRLTGNSAVQANYLEDSVTTVKSSEKAESFEVSLMGDFGVAVVLKPGFSLVQHAQNSTVLIRCMLKQLYVYEDYQKLMSRPIGVAYIESLMH